MGDPFTENSSDLLVPDNRDLADPAVIETKYIELRNWIKVSTTHIIAGGLSVKQSLLQIQEEQSPSILSACQREDKVTATVDFLDE